MTIQLGALSLDGVIPRVAVPFRDEQDPARVAAAKRLGMDFAELRIDQFSACDPGHVLKIIEDFQGVPLLATIRTVKEGGAWSGSEKERLKLFTAILPKVDAVDVELSSSAILTPVIDAARAARKCVVVSFHDFEKTPPLETLESFIIQAKDAGADIAKVAAWCTSPADLRTLAQHTLKHRDRGLVTIGMGTSGMLSRVFFPALGSLFTFASYGEGTAPGQMSLEETVAHLRAFYPQHGSSTGD